MSCVLRWNKILFGMPFKYFHESLPFEVTPAGNAYHRTGFLSWSWLGWRLVLLRDGVEPEQHERYYGIDINLLPRVLSP
jgi:hypothetical protein